MEELEKLQKIGAKEIAAHTHMAVVKVQKILEKDFGALKDKATTMGLIKILQREYKVNLQEWVKEYEQFFSESPQEATEEQKVAVDFKVMHEETPSNNSKKNTGLLVLLTIVLLGGIGAYVYFYLDLDLQTFETSKATTQNTQTIQENTTIQDNNTSLTPLATTLDSSASTPLNTADSNATSLESDSSNPQEQTPTKAEIRPMSNVWVGIIYLDNKQRVSMMLNTPLEIDTSREQTILTGHGMLELDFNGEKSSHRSAERMRFYVNKEGQVQIINQAEYSRYNGGLGW